MSLKRNTSPATVPSIGPPLYIFVPGPPFAVTRTNPLTVDPCCSSSNESSEEPLAVPALATRPYHVPRHIHRHQRPVDPVLLARTVAHEHDSYRNAKPSCLHRLGQYRSPRSSGRGTSSRRSTTRSPDPPVSAPPAGSSGQALWRS